MMTELSMRIERHSCHAKQVTNGHLEVKLKVCRYQ